MSAPPSDNFQAGRRRYLRLLQRLALLGLVAPVRGEPLRIKAARLWPAREYTRLTLEQSGDPDYRFFLLTDPHRLVVDLQGIALDGTLRGLQDLVTGDDPYIRRIRVAQNAPGVVRMVAELKTEVRVNIFTLRPISPYSHRLVIDLYPSEESDPLLAFLQSLPAEKAQVPQKNKAAAAKPEDRDTAASPSSPLTTFRTIVIDPGHGGEDPGAIGRGGTYEKNVVLDIARAVKAELDRLPQMRTALTRDGDYFLSLGQRVRKAQELRADLLVSIHADAFIRPDASGSSVFVLSEHGASSVAARWLANRENRSDLVGGIRLDVPDKHLARTLLDLSQAGTLHDSLKVANRVLQTIAAINPLHRDRVERAAFAVLKSPEVPSLLIETAFISNPNEERKLLSRPYQQQIASAIAKGIGAHYQRETA